ncbi:MAG TPA: histidine phosphatase family protein [Solirubrobacteraceae bacterium]|jgi:probable phosphoglycerate mutase|nr:histidine phosphatase family protein [Solirubrobacteraceae bacterium]
MSGELVIVRHSDTEWTANGRHTSYTDLPLTKQGIERAATLEPRLAGRSFAAVWSSPRERTFETARLAGFEPLVRDGLREWEYGEYEGLTTEQIRESRPGWDIWRDGCPGGEDAAAAGARADALLATLPPEGDVLVFSHGHFSRVLTARWLGLEAAQGALFVLAPAGIGVLGHEHERRVLRSWG